MKNSTQTVTISFFKDEERLVINVTGSYYGGYMGSREDPPEEATFEIALTQIVKGDLMKVLDAYKTTEEIILAMEEKCIEQIQTN